MWDPTGVRLHVRRFVPRRRQFRVRHRLGLHAVLAPSRLLPDRLCRVHTAYHAQTRESAGRPGQEFRREGDARLDVSPTPSSPPATPASSTPSPPRSPPCSDRASSTPLQTPRKGRHPERYTDLEADCAFKTCPRPRGSP
ncbi:hypothetical protein O1L60_40575 [Streptomyces diastatochromogenes]|nr:hypothetical protein [Streptomyces diastatochromogenes]